MSESLTNKVLELVSNLVVHSSIILFMYAKLEAIMCRSWYVFLLITGTERRSAAKIKMRDWGLLLDRSIIDFSIVHLYLFGTGHAVILYILSVHNE